MTLAQGTTPTANTIAMTPLPHVAGTASAIISTCTTAGGSLLGSVSSSAFDGTVRPIALAMFVYLTLAAVLVRWGTAERHDRAQPYQ
jgi:DHA1 family bicyclomycin/chloramphenicol resistance-like MFS transporter